MAFSRAGKSKGSDDQRGTLVLHSLVCISTSRPAVVIMENVPDLASDRHSDILTLIISTLRDLNYVVDIRVLSAIDFDAPQTRSRLYLTASSGRMQWPELVAGHRSLLDVLTPLPKESFITLPFQMQMTSYVLTTWRSIFGLCN